MQLAYEEEDAAAAPVAAKPFDALLLLPQDAEMDAMCRHLVKGLLARMPDGRRCCFALAGSARRLRQWQELVGSCGGRLRRIEEIEVDLACGEALAAAVARARVAVNVSGAVPHAALLALCAAHGAAGVDASLTAPVVALLVQRALAETVKLGADPSVRGHALVEPWRGERRGEGLPFRALGRWVRRRPGAGALLERVTAVEELRAPPPARRRPFKVTVGRDCVRATAECEDAQQMAALLAVHGVHAHVCGGSQVPPVPAALVRAGAVAVAPPSPWLPRLWLASVSVALLAAVLWYV